MIRNFVQRVHRRIRVRVIRFYCIFLFLFVSGSDLSCLLSSASVPRSNCAMYAYYKTGWMVLTHLLTRATDLVSQGFFLMWFIKANWASVAKTGRSVIISHNCRSDAEEDFLFIYYYHKQNT